MHLHQEDAIPGRKISYRFRIDRMELSRNHGGQKRRAKKSRPRGRWLSVSPGSPGVFFHSDIGGESHLHPLPVPGYTRTAPFRSLSISPLLAPQSLHGDRTSRVFQREAPSSGQTAPSLVPGMEPSRRLPPLAESISLPSSFPPKEGGFSTPAPCRLLP